MRREALDRETRCIHCFHPALHRIGFTFALRHRRRPPLCGGVSPLMRLCGTFHNCSLRLQPAPVRSYPCFQVLGLSSPAGRGRSLTGKIRLIVALCAFLATKKTVDETVFIFVLLVVVWRGCFSIRFYLSGVYTLSGKTLRH